ncbi:hypothetical protein [Streptomyces pseudogriseolus]|uniref:hypothetical protein n=1 Tax=Streptomyces pseudogriseolus TaxID=36817 RepID=UPI003FA229A5
MHGTYCGFEGWISRETLTAGLNGQTFTTHEDAHAAGVCARLFKIEHNPEGAPLWHQQPRRAAARRTARPGKLSVSASPLHAAAPA